MVIVMMVADFHLSGCSSLKEKRHRLSGIRDRFGKQSNVAICESAYHDLHKQAQWSFVAIGVSPKRVDQSLSTIENFLVNYIDATITHVERIGLN